MVAVFFTADFFVAAFLADFFAADFFADAFFAAATFDLVDFFAVEALLAPAFFEAVFPADDFLAVAFLACDFFFTPEPPAGADVPTLLPFAFLLLAFFAALPPAAFPAVAEGFLFAADFFDGGPLTFLADLLAVVFFFFATPRYPHAEPWDPASCQSFGPDRPNGAVD